MSEEETAVEPKLIPPKAAHMLMAAHQAAQAAQREFEAVLATVKAALDVPDEWPAQQMPDGAVFFVPPPEVVESAPAG